MENQVLADISPFLPGVLKKVPWELRAFLLFCATMFGLYIIGAEIWVWPLSHNAKAAEGALAFVAGVPALANVTVGKRLTPLTDIEQLARQVAAEFTRIAPAGVTSVVNHYYGQAAQIATEAADTLAAHQAQAETLVNEAVDAVDPAAANTVSGLETKIAPIPAEVASALNDLSAEPTPTVQPLDPTPPVSAPPSEPSPSPSPSVPSAPPVSEIPPVEPLPPTAPSGVAPAPEAVPGVVTADVVAQALVANGYGTTDPTKDAASVAAAINAALNQVPPVS